MLKYISIFLNDINIFIFKKYVKNNDRRYKKVEKIINKIEKLSDSIYTIYYRRAKKCY